MLVEGKKKRGLPSSSLTMSKSKTLKQSHAHTVRKRSTDCKAKKAVYFG